MTDKNIQEIIDLFNKKKGKGFIAANGLGGNVAFGLVWTGKDYHSLTDVAPYRFYFIRDDKGICIGAVLDMRDDLHGYIVPGSRKKGYLTNAFTSQILPHLAASRPVQRVTTNRAEIGDENYKASLASALRSGFKIIEQKDELTVCEIRLARFKKVILKPVYEGMSFERMAELRKDLNVHVAALYHIQAEVEAKLGTSKESRQLKRMVDELQKFRIYKLEDTLYTYLEVTGQRS